jgi:hypothetical protein
VTLGLNAQDRSFVYDGIVATLRKQDSGFTAYDTVRKACGSNAMCPCRSPASDGQAAGTSKYIRIPNTIKIDRVVVCSSVRGGGHGNCS